MGLLGRLNLHYYNRIPCDDYPRRKECCCCKGAWTTVHRGWESAEHMLHCMIPQTEQSAEVLFLLNYKSSLLHWLCKIAAFGRGSKKRPNRPARKIAKITPKAICNGQHRSVLHEI